MHKWATGRNIPQLHPSTTRLIEGEKVFCISHAASALGEQRCTYGSDNFVKRLAKAPLELFKFFEHINLLGPIDKHGVPWAVLVGVHGAQHLEAWCMVGG